MVALHYVLKILKNLPLWSPVHTQDIHEPRQLEWGIKDIIEKKKELKNYQVLVIFNCRYTVATTHFSFIIELFKA